ncbi:hypothetical protein ACFWPY_10420 [Streptomyces sp. NPDC058527]|uniref:hypothetical protein n=1 Tax=Streptomyces sp. NPDC058527 TaxID=3346539 RepID=UPI003655E101
MNILDVQNLRVEYRSEGRTVVGADDVCVALGPGGVVRHPRVSGLGIEHPRQDG